MKDEDKCSDCKGLGTQNAGAGRYGIWSCDGCHGTGKNSKCRAREHFEKHPITDGQRKAWQPLIDRLNERSKDT